MTLLIVSYVYAEQTKMLFPQMCRIFTIFQATLIFRMMQLIQKVLCIQSCASLDLKVRSKTKLLLSPTFNHMLT